MRKSRLVKKTVEVEETVDVLCNMCGKSCIPEDSHPSSRDPYGLIETVVYGGYYSPMFFDMSAYRFSMCEKCLSKLYEQFKIPVEYKSEETFGEYINIKNLPKVSKKWHKFLDEHERKMKKEV